MTSLLGSRAAAAGAGAVPPVVLLRKKAAAAAVVAKKRKKEGPANVNNYGALIVGMEDQIEHWKKPGPLALDPFDGTQLLGSHRELLLQLNKALVLMHTDPEAGLGLWQQLERPLSVEVGKGGRAGIPKQAVDLSYDNIKYASDKLFYPAAYYAAKRAKKAEGHVEAPDMVAMEAKLKKAEKVFTDARQLVSDAAKMASGLVDEKQLHGFEFGGLVDVVNLNGTIEQKLAAAKTRGIAMTATDLVSKMTAAGSTMLKQTSTIGLAYCEKMTARLAGKTGEEVAKKLSTLAKTAERFKNLANLAKRAGDVAAVLAIIVDYSTLVNALIDGDWDTAKDAAVDLLSDAAPLAFGADLAGPLAVGIVVVKAQIEAIHLAAAFIRWCKDETVRQAALDFVDQCSKLANSAAYDLVADAEIILDPTKTALHAIAAQQIEAEAKRVSAGLRVLGSHVTSTEKTAIGAYPDVRKSLGKEALDALLSPADDPLNVTNQIGAVFKGANQMSRHVRYEYTN